MLGMIKRNWKKQSKFDKFMTVAIFATIPLPFIRGNLFDHMVGMILVVGWVTLMWREYKD